jgi:hypothetical protein
LNHHARTAKIAKRVRNRIAMQTEGGTAMAEKQQEAVAENMMVEDVLYDHFVIGGRKCYVKKRMCFCFCDFTILSNTRDHDRWLPGYSLLVD